MVSRASTQSVASAAPSPASESSAPDEHHGKGGSYVMENGVRRLVERTRSPEEAAELERQAREQAAASSTPT